MAVAKLTNIGRLKLTGEYKTDIAMLVKNLSKMEDHIYANLVPTNISGGTSTTISVRWIKQSLSAGVATPISFSPSFTSLPAVAPPRCYNSTGQAIGFDMTTVTVSGFTITPMEDCFMECIAVGV
jgi:hypothetical protein